MKIRIHYLAALLAFGLIGLVPKVEAQQIVLQCVISTSTPCPVSGANPGNGSQGTPIYLAGGAVNVMMGQIYGMFSTAGTWKSSGVVSYLDILNPWTGTKDVSHCPSGGGTMVVCGGGGGTPGGTSGQAQYNNAGNFGGYTVSGDESLNTATGVATVKGANGTLYSSLATGIIKNTTGTGVPSIAVAADFPTLNQNTTGNAATATSATSAGSATTATTAGNLSGTPALPNGTTATTQTVGDNTTKLATDAFVLANASSSGVASAAAGPGIVIAGTGAGPYTGAITISTNAPNRTVTTSPTVASTDMGGQINSNVSGGGTITIPAISTTVFAAGMSATLVNYSASTAAISTTPTINAGGGCVSGTGIPSGYTWELISNGTTLDCSQSSGAKLGALATITPGTGVATALGNAVSTAGGTALTIAAGTAALGTSAITSGSCATVVTVSASGVATTDIIVSTPNGDPTGITGYAPSTSGILTIYPYPTANNVNYKVCNSTASSVTPGALTLNFRVVR